MRKPFFSHPVIRSFVLRFFLLFFLVELFLYFFPPLGYQDWMATQIGNLLHVPVQGTLLFIHGFPFEISAFCSGLTTVALFAGLIFGFDIPSQKTKMNWLLAGGMIILTLNFVRIYLVIWTGLHSSILVAEMLHLVSWFILSAVSGLMWFRWMKKETHAQNGNELARILIRNNTDHFTR